MNKKSLLIPVVVVAAVALAAFWFANRTPGEPAVAESPPGAAAGAAAAPEESGSKEEEVVTLTTTPSMAETAAEESGDEAVLTEDDVWKSRLLDLLNNDTLSDRELGRQLLKMAENTEAPDWLRAHAMTNALNFLDDEHYEEDVKPIVSRPDLPEVVNDAVLDDLINRDPAGILPVARELAAIAGHPLAGAIDGFVKSVETGTEEEEPGTN